MNECLTACGLFLDIVGVSALFWATTPKKLGEELSASIFRDVTNDAKNGEWGHEISFADHEAAVQALETRVARTALVARSALIVIVVGFTLQIVALFVP